jgi:hypothetical protein
LRGGRGFSPGWDTLAISPYPGEHKRISCYVTDCAAFVIFTLTCMPSSVHPKYFRLKNLQFLFIYFLYLGDAALVEML